MKKKNISNTTKKIVIIGGGVAGLSAGINALLNGFEPVIYEKNIYPGGNCSFWQRGAYTIDNCIHWLVGTKKGHPQYEEWVKLGVLDDKTPILKREYFYRSTYQGNTITLWRDLDKTEKEMLELSKEDELEIKKFTNSIRIARELLTPQDNMFDLKNAFKNMNLSVSLKDVMTLLIQYGGLTLEDIAKKFKHPLLQRTLLDFSAKEYEAYWLIISYAFFVYDNADVPIGGSKMIVERLINKYLSLGGKLYCNMGVKKIVLNPQAFKDYVQIPDYKSVGNYKFINTNMRRASHIILDNDEIVTGDYFICTCDINYTFNNLLPKKYEPKYLKRITTEKKCTVYSAFQIAYSVDDPMDIVNDFVYFETKPLKIANQTYHRIGIKNYRHYGDYIAPKDKTVIQCLFIQYMEDYNYWDNLKNNYEKYQKEKEHIAKEILKRIEKEYPKYRGKIHILDVWTPTTYQKYNNCYSGSFMRFITSATNKNAFISCDIKGLSNVLLASHWLRYPGGLPTAASMGELAIDRIVHFEKQSKKKK